MDRSVWMSRESIFQGLLLWPVSPAACNVTPKTVMYMAQSVRVTSTHKDQVNKNFHVILLSLKWTEALTEPQISRESKTLSL